MNSLFEFNGKQININPILLSIKEFEDIWKRDKDKDKFKALKEITYIYAMCSTEEDNIWIGYSDLNERSNVIINDIFGSKSTWVPDRLISTAIDKYKARYPKGPAELLLETSLQSIMKVKDYLDTVDLSEKDDMGRPTNSPKIVLEMSTKAIQTYMEMEEAIEKIRTNKKIKNDRMKGGGEEGAFESGDALNKLI